MIGVIDLIEFRSADGLEIVLVGQKYSDLGKVTKIKACYELTNQGDPRPFRPYGFQLFFEGSSTIMHIFEPLVVRYKSKQKK